MNVVDEREHVVRGEPGREEERVTSSGEENVRLAGSNQESPRKEPERRVGPSPVRSSCGAGSPAPIGREAWEMALAAARLKGLRRGNQGSRCKGPYKEACSKGHASRKTVTERRRGQPKPF